MGRSDLDAVIDCAGAEEMVKLALSLLSISGHYVDVGLVGDRIDVPLGGVGLLPVTGLAKLNGFAGPVELTVVGDGLTGSLTLPAAANPQPTAPRPTHRRPTRHPPTRRNHDS